MENPELKGLRGWLILVGIGVVVSPLRMFAAYGPLYSTIFTDGTWEALTDPVSEFYVPYFGALLIGEMFFNLLMIIVSLYAIYLFFSKSYLFPKFFIGIVVASIIFIVIDAWLVSILVPESPMFDEQTLGELLRSVLVGLIWIPYMLVSKRVKATFVEGAPQSFAATT